MKLMRSRFVLRVNIIVLNVVIAIMLLATSCANPQLPGTSPPELTYEQDLSINPPPPTALKATIVAQGIQLSWESPPPVSVPHYYSDQVLYFKVYRRTEDTQFAYLAQTTEMVYIDQSALTGIKYYFTVTAMHENGIESSRAQEVGVEW